MSDSKTTSKDEEGDMTVEQCISKLINKLLKYLKQAGADDKIIERYETEIVKIEGMGDIYYILSLMLENLVENLTENKPPKSDSDYKNLEKLVQKHEAEIRNHVRTEQQLRLYIENMENDEEGKKNQFSGLESAVKKSNQEKYDLQLEVDRLKKELIETKFKLKKEKGKFLETRKLCQDKKNLTYSQESIVKKSNLTEKKDLLKNFKKSHKGCLIQSFDPPKSKIIINNLQDLNETGDTSYVKISKTKKFLTSKLPSNLTERRTDNTYNAESIQKIIQSHRRLQEGVNRGSLVLSNNSKLSIANKPASKKSGMKAVKKKVPIFERKEVLRGHYKAKSHIPIKQLNNTQNQNLNFYIN